MKIVTISDTHSQHGELDIPDCDIIIHAGDSTGMGRKSEIEAFIGWLSSLPHRYKILIAGNHDWGFSTTKGQDYAKMCEDGGIIYLNDSGCVVEDISIWGSPVQPEFCNWAFNKARTKEESSDFGTHPLNRHEYIGTHWDKIPEGVDILVTHGPPYGVLDQVKMIGSSNRGQNVGCEILAEKVLKIKPKLHVFGHIHEGRGVIVDKLNLITYANASCLDAYYKKYIDNQFVFDWKKVKTGDSCGKDI